MEICSDVVSGSGRSRDDKPAHPTPTVGHRRLLFTCAACLLALAGCGSSSGTTARTTAKLPTTRQTATGASAGSSATISTATATATGTAGVITGSADGVSATLHAGTHRPRVNQAWPIHFTVTRAGHPIRASVSYEYLFAGQVVAHRSHYTFLGHFSDVFRWPSAAVGYPLTFRAVIVGEGATIDLDYPVQVTQ